MDKRKEKLLSVARAYVYPVGIQIIDSSKHLRDELGYLGKLPLFERYGLLVLVNEAFGKNVFFLMILTDFCTLLKKVFYKRRKGTFYFVPFIYSFRLFYLYIYFDGKSVYLRVSPSPSNTRFFLYKKNIFSRLRMRTLLYNKSGLHYS